MLHVEIILGVECLKPAIRSFCCPLCCKLENLKVKTMMLTHIREKNFIKTTCQTILHLIFLCNFMKFLHFCCHENSNCQIEIHILIRIQLVYTSVQFSRILRSYITNFSENFLRYRCYCDNFE